LGIGNSGLILYKLNSNFKRNLSGFSPLHFILEVSS
jgi:hypothetical protein